MEPIRIVWGQATGPTEMSSYDAALAEAGVENYNLVAVSSVIPQDAEVEVVGTAPDLGPVGERLTVVQARATTTEPGHVSAGLGWAQSPEGGLFYEASGDTDEADVDERVRRGLAAGQALRDWEFGEPHVKVESAAVEPGTYTTAVVLAVYGGSDPLL
ncbi:pyruvoyl-dependent arginine decarboxylase [Haloarchaeobius sp. HME9146]|uniref:pyruvoyl-dependent arginine decarboxylase n=1 Tax=Haloarchaeobius sp. HME9146 TaxID=2978732 RepID=UPI0021BFAC2D|nr:pyruvoyl-dependent arginine decarboxylase [Haloarchaeobius sp. HME9146]MCT9094412.1 pyruvoyl-dependent arginine decarboxylase [Haloarchaeobius sp. HME9146]